MILALKAMQVLDACARADAGTLIDDVGTLHKVRARGLGETRKKEETERARRSRVGSVCCGAESGKEKGNSVDVKGKSVDVKGKSVDVKGNIVAVKGKRVDVLRANVWT